MTTAVSANESAACSPAEARRRYREGLAVPTSGWATGFTQTNMVVVPATGLSTCCFSANATRGRCRCWM